MSTSFSARILETALKNWEIVFRLVLFITCIHQFIVYPFFTSPLANVPGPKLNAITGWYMIYIDFTKQRTWYIHNLHQKYGPIVRIGPNEVYVRERNR